MAGVIPHHPFWSIGGGIFHNDFRSRQDRREPRGRVPGVRFQGYRSHVPVVIAHRPLDGRVHHGRSLVNAHCRVLFAVAPRVIDRARVYLVLAIRAQRQTGSIGPGPFIQAHLDSSQPGNRVRGRSSQRHRSHIPAVFSKRAGFTQTQGWIAQVYPHPTDTQRFVPRVILSPILHVEPAFNVYQCRVGAPCAAGDPRLRQRQAGGRVAPRDEEFEGRNVPAGPTIWAASGSVQVGPFGVQLKRQRRAHRGNTPNIILGPPHKRVIPLFFVINHRRGNPPAVVYIHRRRAHSGAGVGRVHAQLRRAHIPAVVTQRPADRWPRCRRGQVNAERETLLAFVFGNIIRTQVEIIDTFCSNRHWHRTQQYASGTSDQVVIAV